MGLEEHKAVVRRYFEAGVNARDAAVTEELSATQARLDEPSRDFLAGLHAADESREVALYHASPRDHVWEYVLWPEQAGECIQKQAKRIALIGHSHIALCFQVSAGTKLDVSEGRWLLNPGSVGQPRDGDTRAAWLELDTDAWTATYHRIEYEIERAAESIAAAGLPEHLGKRLFVGQ